MCQKIVKISYFEYLTQNNSAYSHGRSGGTAILHNLKVGACLALLLGKLLRS